MQRLKKEKYSNRQIEKGLREKDNTIGKYVYNRYYPMVCSLVEKYGGEKSVVDDVFQDSLLEILIKLKDPDFYVNFEFSTYFYTICKNKVIDLLRKDRSTVNYMNRKLMEEEEAHPVESIDNEIISKVFIEAFNSLGSNCKTILNLHFREHSLMEIASIISVKYTTVRKRKERCIAELGEKITLNPAIKCMLDNNPDTSQFMIYGSTAV